jgi:hypothetical protein
LDARVRASGTERRQFLRSNKARDVSSMIRRCGWQPQAQQESCKAAPHVCRISTRQISLMALRHPTGCVLACSPGGACANRLSVFRESPVSRPVAKPSLWRGLEMADATRARASLSVVSWKSALKPLAASKANPCKSTTWRNESRRPGRTRLAPFAGTGDSICGHYRAQIGVDQEEAGLMFSDTERLLQPPSRR